MTQCHNLQTSSFTDNLRFFFLHTFEKLVTYKLFSSNQWIKHNLHTTQYSPISPQMPSRCQILPQYPSTLSLLYRYWVSYCISYVENFHKYQNYYIRFIHRRHEMILVQLHHFSAIDAWNMTTYASHRCVWKEFDHISSPGPGICSTSFINIRNAIK